MTILHLRICPQRHPNLRSNPGRVNLDKYDLTDESPEMWRNFLTNVATQVGGSDLGDPTIHEPGRCGELPHTRRSLQRLKLEYVDADDTEDIYPVHFEQAPQADMSTNRRSKAQAPPPTDEMRSESDSDNIVFLPNPKKAASKSRKPKRSSHRRVRDRDEDAQPTDERPSESDSDNILVLPNPRKAARKSRKMKRASRRRVRDRDEDEDHEDEQEDAFNNEGEPDLTRSDDGNPLIRLGIWPNHDDAQPTLNGNIAMDIVMVAEILSEDEIKYYSVPSWFVNGISIGHFERGKMVEEKDIALMASSYTEDSAFTGQNTPEKIRRRLFQLLNNANTREVPLNDYTYMEKEEVDENLLIQPPRTPYVMNEPFPSAPKAKRKAKLTKGKKQQNDKSIDIVVYFANNVATEDLPLELNWQLELNPEESFPDFDEWLLDGHEDYKGIRKGLENEVDEGGWDHNIEYEVFVLPQRSEKDGTMWNWKEQPSRTVASFLNASMEEEYGRKLYVEVHLNVHRDAEKMNDERDKKFEEDLDFAKRVGEAKGRLGEGSGRGTFATETGLKKKKKKAQKDLPARKGVARKKQLKPKRTKEGSSR
ncbi:hypothetical protein AC578_6998 [Pseudocercospora eumusae]|uniref:Uncharacterized protein n=1 Tax=Pseudocercospora eumusae TaxID=321146 RepID=A0A139GTM8_9PEZI|nr:hypothetical protein AC578_6998 [Pseudocercospora eumusae]